MHPALSVIFFTTLSGAGYGLLGLLGAGIALGWWPKTFASVAVPALLGMVLAGIGLLASMAHLGQPQRAWRAFSQWRSSWLSREGVCAMLSYLPALAVVYCSWRLDPKDDWPLAARVAAALLLLAAIATVYCTARIYSSLRTIPAWNNAWVAPVYLVLAAFSGSLWLWLLGSWQHRHDAVYWNLIGLPPWLLMGVVLGAMLATALKLMYWRRLDQAAPLATSASATGLGRFGAVSSFEKPHTEQNYINREMGFVVARKHAQKLRAVALLAGLALPLALIGASVVWTGFSLTFALLALLGGSAGIFVERWLFFAEARHVVNLYYGSSQV